MPPNSLPRVASATIAANSAFRAPGPQGGPCRKSTPYSVACVRAQAHAKRSIGLNAWLGWWWADPAAALVIAGLAIREGMEAWTPDDN